MTADLLIRHALIVTSSGRSEGDVAIRDGKILSIGATVESAEVVDAKGLSLLPGVIDTQVHFREPGFEHKEDIQSGTQSAALGGVTTVFEMPNTDPPTTCREALEDKLARAKERSWCNIAFFVGAGQDNVESLSELEMLPGTPGIKIFMGSSTGSLLVPDDHSLRKVLREGKRRTPIHAEDNYRLQSRRSLISEHPSPAEHPFLRDCESARMATERVLNLSRETGRPVHILHVSTADELPLLEQAKRESIGTTCEVTPQHLWFAAPECYERLGSLAQMNPPVRSEEHRSALRAAVKAGLFDVIGSDHAPHTLEEKAQPYPLSPSGMPGVQTLLPVMITLALDGLMPLEQLVEMTSAAPARIYGIKNKGLIEPGHDADLVLVDLNRKAVVERSWIASKCGWSPFEGETLTGWPVHTLVGGRFAVREGALSLEPYGASPEFDWKV